MHPRHQFRDTSSSSALIGKAISPSSHEVHVIVKESNQSLDRLNNIDLGYWLAPTLPVIVHTTQYSSAQHEPRKYSALSNFCNLSYIQPDCISASLMGNQASGHCPVWAARAALWVSNHCIMPSACMNLLDQRLGMRPMLQRNIGSIRRPMGALSEAWSKQLHRHMTDWTNKYGPIWKVHFGALHVVGITDPVASTASTALQAPG